MGENLKRWVLMPLAQTGAAYLGKVLAKYLTVIAAVPEWVHAVIYGAALVSLLTFTAKKYWNYRLG